MQDVIDAPQSAQLTIPGVRELVIIQTGIVEFDSTANALAELEHRLRGIAYQGLHTLAGMQEAVDDRRMLRDLRIGVDKIRDKLNRADRAAVKERCDKRDAGVEQLTLAIRALEDPIDQQIKAEEARKEAIRIEKQRAEQARVAAHHANIEKIRAILRQADGRSSEQIARALEYLRSMTFPPEQSEEFLPQYEAARAETLEHLGSMHLAALAAEQLAREQEARRIEQERIAAEQRAEAERLAEEQRKLAERERELAVRMEEARRTELQAEIDRREREARDSKPPESVAAPATTVAAQETPAQPAPPVGQSAEDIKLIHVGAIAAKFGRPIKSGWVFTLPQLVKLIDHVTNKE